MTLYRSGARLLRSREDALDASADKSQKGGMGAGAADLAELRAFVALADLESFSAAAQLLGRDATVLSRRLQALEARLGVRLADRSTRRLGLTEAGAAYLAAIRPLLEGLDAADREVSAYADGEPRGNLRVALPGSFARLWLEPVLLSFTEKHPHVTLDIEYSNRFVDIIAERFDLAIRLAELPDTRLIARKVAERRRLVVASPAYLAASPPITTPSDLAQHACLVYTGRRNPRRWEFKEPGDGQCTVAVTSRIASDDADLLIAAAVSGLGVFYTTDWHVGPHLADGTLVEVLADWPPPDKGAIYVVTPFGAGMPNKVRAFSDWIASALHPAPWSASLPAR